MVRCLVRNPPKVTQAVMPQKEQAFCLASSIDMTCRLDISVVLRLNFLSWDSQLVVGVSEVVGCIIERMLRVPRWRVVVESSARVETIQGGIWGGKSQMQFADLAGSLLVDIWH